MGFQDWDSYTSYSRKRDRNNIFPLMIIICEFVYPDWFKTINCHVWSSLSHPFWILFIIGFVLILFSVPYEFKDLLHATAVMWGWYQIKSQHKKLTWEKIHPPLLPGLKPETFRSQVWCSTRYLSLLPRLISPHLVKTVVSHTHRIFNLEGFQSIKWFYKWG